MSANMQHTVHRLLLTHGLDSQNSGGNTACKFCSNITYRTFPLLLCQQYFINPPPFDRTFKSKIHIQKLCFGSLFMSSLTLPFVKCMTLVRLPIPTAINSLLSTFHLNESQVCTALNSPINVLKSSFADVCMDFNLALKSLFKRWMNKTNGE